MATRADRSAFRAVLTCGALLCLAAPIYAAIACAPLPTGASREWQTFSTTRDFHARGIDLLRPRMDLYPEPALVVLEFPAYQAVVAALAHVAGLSHALGRGVAVAAFLAGAGYLFALVRRTGPPQAELLPAFVLAAYLFNAACLDHQATFMVDPLGIALSIAATYHGARWLLDRSALHAVACVGLGLLACLIKSYFAPSLCAALVGIVLCASRDDPALRRRGMWRLACVFLLWFLAVLGWTSWATSCNEQSSAFWIRDADALFAQQLGTAEHRAQLGYWRAHVASLHGSWRAIDLVLALGAAAQLVVTRSPHAWLPLLWLVGALVARLVFFQVSATHHYYALTWIAPVSCLVGHGAWQVWLQLERLASAPRLVVLRWALLATWFVAPVHLAVAGLRRRAEPPAPTDDVRRMGAYIRDHSAPGEVVAIASARGYFPELHHFSERRGYMLRLPASVGEETDRDGFLDLAGLRQVRGGGVRSLFVVLGDRGVPLARREATRSWLQREAGGVFLGGDEKIDRWAIGPPAAAGR